MTLGSASRGRAHVEDVMRTFGFAFSLLCPAEAALNLAALAHAEFLVTTRTSAEEAGKLAKHWKSAELRQAHVMRLKPV